ncbi:MAG: translocation/assembly module TamB domain-containing protein [Endomicrobiales bacterium]|nr:translocation/assembly module TamB domain-containing protein [Endomicrobiales bacterium]
MWKRLLILTTLALIAAVMLAGYLSFKYKVFDSPVRNLLQNLTGQQVTFEKITYKPLDRLSIENLCVGKHFSAKSAAVRISVLKAITRINDPSSWISNLYFDSPIIILDDARKSLLPLAGPAKAKGKTDLNIYWEKGKILYRKVSFKKFSGRISIDGILAGKIRGELASNPVDVDITSEKAGVETFTSVIVKSSGESFNALWQARVRKMMGQNYSADVSFDTFRWKDYSLDKAALTVLYNKSGMYAVFKSRAGRVEAKSSGSDDITLEGGIKADELNRKTSGYVEFYAKIKDGQMKGTLKSTSIAVEGMEFKDLKADVARDAKGSWIFNTDFGRERCAVKAELNGSSRLNVDLTTGKISKGRLEGTLRPLDLSLSVKSMPVGRLPFVRDMLGEMSGVLSAEGSIRQTTATLKVGLERLKYGGLEPADFLIVCKKNAKGRLFRIDSKQAGVNFKYSDDPESWQIKAMVKRFNLAYLNRMDKRMSHLEGKISGTASYSSSKYGTAKFDSESIKYKDTILNDVKLSLSMTPEYLIAKYVSAKVNDGSVSAQGRTGLKDISNECRIDLEFKDFPLSGRNKLSGRAAFTGTFYRGGDWNLSGQIRSNELKAGRWRTKKFSSYIYVSKKKMEMKEMMWFPFFGGMLSYYQPTKALEGNITVTDFPLWYFEKRVNGILNGNIALGGYLHNPQVTLNYDCINARYGEVEYSHSGRIKYLFGVLAADGVEVRSGTNTVRVAGQLWPKPEITGIIRNLSTDLIGKFQELPEKTSGYFRGKFSAKGEYSAPSIEAEILGKNIMVSGKTLSEVNAKIEYEENKLAVKDALIKYLDSEIKILPDTRVDILNGNFDGKLELRNVSAGPIEIFGPVKLKGGWSTGSDATAMVITRIETDDLWMNQFNLEDFAVDMNYSNRVLTFIPVEKSAVKVSGQVDITSLSSPVFYRFSISTGLTAKFVLDGAVGGDKWDFLATGKNTSVATITELTNLQFPFGGNGDFNIVGKGTLDNPQIEASINLSNGNVSDLAYDNINFQLSVRQNVLSVVQGRLFSEKLFTSVVTGYMPFFLTQKSRERVVKNPMDISINMEEGSLDVIRLISSDIKSGKGILRMQTHVTGTYERPMINGYLKVAEGEINSKRYFDKMTQINIDAVFRNNFLSIREITGKVGEGNMKLYGSVRFAGFRPKTYDLRWLTTGKEGVPIKVPELPIPNPLFKSDDWLLTNLSNGRPKFDLRMTGTFKNPKLSGWIEIANTHFTYPSLAKPSDRESILDDLWPKLSWDLELKAGKNTWYDNDLVSVNITGGVKFSGRGSEPTVDGHIEALRGSVVYFGTEFKIRRAVIEIVKDEVFIEGEAETEIKATSVNESDTIRLIIEKSEISKIQPKFISKNNPNLSPERAMARATGLDPDSLSQTEISYNLRKSIIRFVDSTLTTPLARNILRRSGVVDTFRVQYVNKEPVKPQDPTKPTLTELMQGTKYSLEKYVTSDVLFGYSMTFDMLRNKLDLRHELELSYNLRKNLYLKGSYELGAGDLLRQTDKRITLEQQWRFGGKKEKKK